MKKILSTLVIWFCIIACKKDETSPLVNLPANLKNLKIEHPRLFLTDQKLEELKVTRKTDAILDKYVSAVIATSNSLLTKPMLTRILIGPRLLDVCLELL